MPGSELISSSVSWKRKSTDCQSVEQGVLGVELAARRAKVAGSFGGIGFEVEPLLAAVAKGCRGDAMAASRRDFLREIFEGASMACLVCFVAHGFLMTSQVMSSKSVVSRGLVLLVGDHEAAPGLQAGGDALLEGAGDGSTAASAAARCRGSCPRRCWSAGRTDCRALRRARSCPRRARRKISRICLGCAKPKRTCRRRGRKRGNRAAAG